MERPPPPQCPRVPRPGQGPDGKEVQVLGLADARQISEKVVFLLPAAQMILPLMDGTRTLEAIATEIGRGLNRRSSSK